MSRNINTIGLALQGNETAATVRWPADLANQYPVGATAGTPAIEIVDTPEGLALLHDEWRELERDAPACTVFQSFEWCNAWFHRYAAGRDGVRLYVLVGRRNGTVALIWPLMATRHAGVWILKWLSDPFSQYGDVLLRNGEPSGPWIEAAWAAIGNDRSLDAVSLRHIRTDAALHGFLTARCGAPVSSDAAPFLDMSGFDGIDAYQSSLSRNQRASRSKLRKKIARQGELAFTVHREGPAFENAVALALGFKREWLETHGKHTDVLLEPGFEAFMRDLGRGAADGPTAAAGVLTRDGVPLSIDIGIHFKGEYFGYLIVQDQSLLDQSPAKVHLDLLQRWTIENGFTRFDLMVPGDPYKQHWSNGSMQVDDFAFAITTEGRFYCGFYLKTLRPMVKRLYHALPLGVRRPLVDLLRAGHGEAG